MVLPTHRPTQTAMAEADAAVELWGLPPEVSDELLTLYFENRRSGGGPVLSWKRLGCGGILTFREPADAARVLAQGEHMLLQARLSLRPAPPWAPARLLLLGLRPGITAQRLEQHVQTLLSAAGLPQQVCRALDSPRPDRALVQLQEPLSEAEFGVLEEKALALDLDGDAMSLVRVPQARAVRVMRGTSPPDPFLLELYLENQPRSGGGPLEGLRTLPGDLGMVVSFRQWQVAERVLQRDHWLQDSELYLVPHYDVLEPQELAVDPYEGDHVAGLWQARDHNILEAKGPSKTLEGRGPVIETVEAWGPPGITLNPGPEGPLGQEGPVSQGSLRSLEQGDLVEIVREEMEPPVEMVQTEVVRGQMEQRDREPVEMVLSMDPGALRFLQLYHEDLLANLGDVALFPLEGSDVAGFRICGALAPCQAAEEFLRSLLGSLSCHMLTLKYPGSASFLLGPEGQQLLRDLEAQFQCVFGTEQLTRVTVDTGYEEVDPTEALQAHTPVFPEGSSNDQETVGLEEVQELMATLEGLDGEEWLPLEQGEGKTEETRPIEEEAEASSVGCSELEAMPPSPGAPEPLQEAASLQLALHRSLEPGGGVAEQEEAAALQRAVALSLLEQPPSGVEVGPAQLLVHSSFEQDLEELERALEAALEAHLCQEKVYTRGQVLPEELRAQLERYHGVMISLCEDSAVFHGFSSQPARAIRHFKALLAGPRDQSHAFPLGASGLPPPQPRLKGSSIGLEQLAESSPEFQEVVQAFYDTLDAAHSSIRIVSVEHVSHPLLQQQYALQRQLLEQRCERRQAEQVLYHGTSASAVQDICAHGFNRSYCGRNGTLYGKGVYFAKRASLSVQDRYSPPNADGHKAVFVARVLTGDYGQGHQGLRAPPPRAAGHDLLRYDSAVDSLDQPNIFVIFHDTQALPTHLITCEHIPGASPGESLGRSGHSLMIS
ncbi:PREDICTED: poly [ADP-ribose] polymerase 10 [Chrysochloris asiatica]|uniref:Poly [ADP-ribose] polymerase n=1 Tax=Chrysochloris asiatica TaxID=185453 RepID=A0A9B0T3S6_CHRAS|nr:PREDICTED: poly [ADP-ribose] polymerase 10 [Chrysochloris asiatica]